MFVSFLNMRMKDSVFWYPSFSAIWLMLHPVSSSRDFASRIFIWRRKSLKRVPVFCLNILLRYLGLRYIAAAASFRDVRLWQLRSAKRFVRSPP